MLPAVEEDCEEFWKLSNGDAVVLELCFRGQAIHKPFLRSRVALAPSIAQVKKVGELFGHGKP